MGFTRTIARRGDRTVAQVEPVQRRPGFEHVLDTDRPADARGMAADHGHRTFPETEKGLFDVPIEQELPDQVEGDSLADTAQVELQPRLGVAYGMGIGIHVQVVHAMAGTSCALGDVECAPGQPVMPHAGVQDRPQGIVHRDGPSGGVPVEHRQVAVGREAAHDRFLFAQQSLHLVRKPRAGLVCRGRQDHAQPSVHRREGPVKHRVAYLPWRSRIRILRNATSSP